MIFFIDLCDFDSVDEEEWFGRVERAEACRGEMGVFLTV